MYTWCANYKLMLVFTWHRNWKQFKPNSAFIFAWQTKLAFSGIPYYSVLLNNLQTSMINLKLLHWLYFTLYGFWHAACDPIFVRVRSNGFICNAFSQKTVMASIFTFFSHYLFLSNRRHLCAHIWNSLKYESTKLQSKWNWENVQQYSMNKLSNSSVGHTFVSHPHRMGWWIV